MMMFFPFKKASRLEISGPLGRGVIRPPVNLDFQIGRKKIIVKQYIWCLYVIYIESKPLLVINWSSITHHHQTQAKLVLQYSHGTPTKRQLNVTLPKFTLLMLTIKFHLAC